MKTGDDRFITFSLRGMIFEYDEDKNKRNIEKHGISFRSAARIFFDYDRIEFYDEDNSAYEDRFDTIGNISIGMVNSLEEVDNKLDYIYNEDILFVVYTERLMRSKNGKKIEVTRLISARYATNFERGMYYGKY